MVLALPAGRISPLGSLRVIANDSAPAASPASSATTNAAGQPTRRFTKEIVKAGTFVKDGDAFNIDGALLDTFVASFGKMKAAGVKVPLPAGHTTKAEANQGWVEDIFREGDSLVATIEAVGQDAIAMAARNDVSIGATKDFVDGKGNAYPWAITHVALTPVPVVPGMSGFVQIAASQDGGEPIKAPVYRPAQEKRAMDFTKIALAMGIAATALTEANATDLIVGHFDKLKAEAKPKDAQPVPPMVLSLATENRQAKIDRLLSGGKISKAVGDDLKAAFIGDKGKAIEFDMGPIGQQNAVFDAVIAALEKNNPVELGEKTRGVRFSRETPDDTKKYDPKITEEMSAMAYGAAKK